MHVETLIALWVTICQRQRVGIKSREQMELSAKYVNHHLTLEQERVLGAVLERWAGEKYRKAYKDLYTRYYCTVLRFTGKGSGQIIAIHHQNNLP